MAMPTGGHGGVFKRGGGLVDWWGLDEIVGGRDYMAEAWECLPPDSFLCAIGAVFFGGADFLFSSIPLIPLVESV